jgi:hypothetical protein
MPYLAFDLDAMDKAANLARAAHITEEMAIAGLARMWRHCWQEKTDEVDGTAIEGFFGTDTSKALVSFRFLEARQAAFRVRGAERYLRISEARSKGGKKAKGNLIPGPHKGDPAGDSAGGPAGEEPEAQPEKSSGSPPALTLSIEHRALNLKEKKEGGDCDASVVVTDVSPLIQKALEVYAHYRDRFNRRHLEPSIEERDTCVARLRDGFEVDELKKAVEGLWQSDWHAQRGFTALRYALGSRDAVERCIVWAERPPDAPEKNGNASLNLGGPTEFGACATCGDGASCKGPNEDWICYACLAGQPAAEAG